jgi:RNA-directed DNA polymerase
MQEDRFEKRQNLGKPIGSSARESQGKYVADNRVIDLVAKFLKAEILDGQEHWEPESGVPHGAVISPLLINLHLNELDHMMAAAGFEMTRYADDLVIQCKTLTEAALAKVAAWTSERGLTLHPTKTKIVDVEVDGFEFLGYRFIKHRRFPRNKSMMKFKDTRSGSQSLSNRFLRGSRVTQLNGNPCS